MLRIQTCGSSPSILLLTIVDSVYNRGFIPDSGHLVHLQTPQISDTVRVDAGFVAGDEVSSHYDPMIAKLIVRGDDRVTAIRKLRTALEQYEIAGLVTNVEFLKRICQDDAFISGEVETGFINKHREKLFSVEPLSPELFAQAALGTILKEISVFEKPRNAALATPFGFSSKSQSYRVEFTAGEESTKASVDIVQLYANRFSIKVNGIEYAVESRWNPQNHILTTYFSHTRLETRVIISDNDLTLFQQGKQYRLHYAVPGWIEKALGVQELANSVLAPMPCKILRVEVNEGDAVEKDQALVVIESMKMETVIRSPQDGVVRKIVHRQGVRSHIGCWNFLRKQLLIKKRRCVKLGPH